MIDEWKLKYTASRFELNTFGPKQFEEKGSVPWMIECLDILLADQTVSHLQLTRIAAIPEYSNPTRQATENDGTPRVATVPIITLADAESLMSPEEIAAAVGSPW